MAPMATQLPDPADAVTLPFAGLRVVRVAAGPQLIIHLGDARSDAAAGSIAFCGRWRCDAPGGQSSGEYDNAHAADATTLLGLLGAAVAGASAHPNGTLDIRLAVGRAGTQESWRLQIVADPGSDGWIARAAQGLTLAGRNGQLTVDQSADPPPVPPPA